LTTRNGRAKSRIGAVLLAALVGSLLAFVSPAAAWDSYYDTTPNRLAGDDRYETAAAVLDAIIDEEGCESRISIATGENFPDGLAAAGLDQPLLLTGRDAWPLATQNALIAMATECGGTLDLDIIGGPSVISSAQFEALETLSIIDTVTRLSGSDRYATALAIAKEIDPTPCDVILATGEGFADALSAGPLSIEADAPIVLNDGASLRADVKAYVGGMDAAGGCFGTAPTVHVIGGTSAVPASIASEIVSMGLNVNRIKGDNRSETAAAIATVLCEEWGGCYGATLVNQNGFADALSAAWIAEVSESPLLLVNSDSIPSATAEWHVANSCDLVEYVLAVGGTAVVSEATLKAAIGAATCVPPTYTATIATVGATQQAFVISDAGALTTSDGPTLTAVAGSAADGIAHLKFPITITDKGTAATCVSDAVPNPGVALTVNICGLASASQAHFVTEWNSTTASALFTAAPHVPAVFGAPPKFDATPSPVMNAIAGKTGTLTQQMVLTFSVEVDNCGGAGATVIDPSDIVGEPLTAVSSVLSPISGTPGGATVYTWTFVIAAASDFRAVGDSTNAIAGEVCSVATDEAVDTTVVKLTAG